MFRCGACGAFNRVPADKPAGTAVCGRCKSALDTSGKPQEVNAQGLEHALGASPLPVLVDFWAPWCGPCRAAAPILDSLARQRAGSLVVLKLNTEETPEPAQRLGIRGIPTFILFSAGAERKRLSGLLPAPEFSRWVDQALEGR
jgi:thioredoxin 2